MNTGNIELCNSYLVKKGLICMSKARSLINNVVSKLKNNDLENNLHIVTLTNKEIYTMIGQAANLRDGDKVQLKVNYKLSKEEFEGVYTVREYEDDICLDKVDGGMLMSRLIENLLDNSVEIVAVNSDTVPAKIAQVEDMELGNIMFGHSRGEYVFPEYFNKQKSVWDKLLEEAHVDSYGNPDNCDEDYFENDVFAIRPYYWGDDKKEMELPNFYYKPTKFQISWYKYPFRDSYMNQGLSAREVEEIFRKCLESLDNRK